MISEQEKESLRNLMYEKKIIDPWFPFCGVRFQRIDLFDFKGERVNCSRGDCEGLPDHRYPVTQMISYGQIYE